MGKWDEELKTLQSVQNANALKDDQKISNNKSYLEIKNKGLFS